MTDAFADWDSAYVLGALAPDDRRRYEEHLAGCASCSAAVGELAGLPGLLRTVERQEAEAIRALPDASPPAAHAAGSVGRAGVAARGVVGRRRRARFAIAAAVVVLLIAGAGTGWAFGRAASPAVELAAARTLTPVGDSHLFAQLRVTSVGWGTRIDWDCDYRAPSTGRADADAVRATSYSLVVHTSAGRTATVATWTSDGGEAKDLVAATSIPADAIERIDIRLTGAATPLSEVRF